MKAYKVQPQNPTDQTENTIQTDDSLQSDTSSENEKARNSSQFSKDLDKVINRITVFKALYQSKKPFFLMKKD